MTQFTASMSHAIDVRITGVLRARANREAVVKSYVLNQYANMTLGCGFVISPTAMLELTVKFFDEIITDDPKTAQSNIFRARRHLLEKYPDWIPNLFHLATELKHAGKAHFDEARTNFFRALSHVQDMVIDSDHYAQIFIDCRYDPLHPDHPWPPTNQMPHFIVERMLRAFKDSLPHDADVPQIIARLRLK